MDELMDELDNKAVQQMKEVWLAGFDCGVEYVKHLQEQFGTNEFKENCTDKMWAKIEPIIKNNIKENF